jgi:hypothetical protein
LLADKEFNGVEAEINDLFSESDEIIVDCVGVQQGASTVIYLLSNRALYALVNLKVVADKLVTAQRIERQDQTSVCLVDRTTKKRVELLAEFSFELDKFNY